MPTDRDPLNLGDRANPAPRVDPDPVACPPDPGVVEGVDQDCDEEQCDDEESYVEPWTDYPDGRYDPWAEDHVEPAPQRVLDLLSAPEPDSDCDGADPDGDGLADSEGVDYRADDCDGEDDRADGDEPDTDDEFVTVRRGEDFECDDEIEESWSWTGDPLIAVFDSAKGAMAGADRYYDQRLDWWEEEPGYWMAHRPGGRMDPFNDDEDGDSADPDDDCDPHPGEPVCPGCPHCAELEGDDDGPFENGDELDGESGEACYRCGSTVDVGRYHGRWICDDCDDEEDCDDA